MPNPSVLETNAGRTGPPSGLGGWHTDGVTHRTPLRLDSRVAIMVLAVVLAASTLLPWYTSQALVDTDRYIGTPLPLVDWVVVALCVLVLVVPRSRRVAGGVGLASAAVTALMMLGESAEGVQVRPGIGLVVAALTGVALLVARLPSRQAGG